MKRHRLIWGVVAVILLMWGAHAATQAHWYGIPISFIGALIVARLI